MCWDFPGNNNYKICKKSNNFSVPKDETKAKFWSIEVQSNGTRIGGKGKLLYWDNSGSPSSSY